MNTHSPIHPTHRQMCNLIHTLLSPKRIKNKKKELWCVVLSWRIQIENIFFYQSHIRVDVGSFVYSLDRATGGVAHHRATLLHEYSCTFFFNESGGFPIDFFSFNTNILFCNLMALMLLVKNRFLSLSLGQLYICNEIVAKN